MTINLSTKARLHIFQKNKSTTDPLEKELIENKHTSFVFARIDKSDDYYFLGLVRKCIDANEFFEPLKMVKFTFELHQNLTKEIWQYFKTYIKIKNRF